MIFGRLFFILLLRLLCLLACDFFVPALAGHVAADGVELDELRPAELGQLVVLILLQGPLGLRHPKVVTLAE